MSEGGPPADHHTLTKNRSDTQIKGININTTNLIEKNGAIHHVCCIERRGDGEPLIDRRSGRAQVVGGNTGRLRGVIDRDHRCSAHLPGAPRITEHLDVEGFGSFRGEIVCQGLPDLEPARGIHHTGANHRAPDKISVRDPSA